MGPRLLLNIDLGELPGEPESLYALADIANIACGGHAGDDSSMRRAIDLCVREGTRIGAHPSFPDRADFGRRELPMAPQALRAAVSEQCSRLMALARERDQSVVFLKPHGALYHTTHRDRTQAGALIDGAVDALGTRVTVIGPAGGELEAYAARTHLAFAREGFADRGTRPDGSLIPRGEPGAVLTDPRRAAQRARDLAARAEVDTICVHGDSPGALEMARAVREALASLAEG